MDGQKSQRKLTTRTESSLLRSSPTIRSSIHNETEPDIEEQKPHGTASTPVPSPFRPGPAVIAVFLIAICTLFYFFNRANTSTSENLLVALVFVAILLYFAEKNKLTIHGYYNGLKTKLGLVSNNSSSGRVEWFIGEQELEKKGKVIREGVEVYNNGDKYEGEFHNGKSNGSGVYTFSVNGKYEGDWIDGKYDGYVKISKVIFWKE